MGILKGDNVTDKDIENLFDNNNSEAFSSNEPENESLIPPELDARSEETTTIKRPLWDNELKQHKKWNVSQIREDKREDKRQQEILKNQTDEELLNSSGSVTTEIFNRVAEIKKKAQLDEFVSNQRKLPVISSQAKYRLYNDKPVCNFHVFKPDYILTDNVILCSCKFCSQEKIFPIDEWKRYELENRAYI